jgi:DNA polymerase I-like protein with 3'-5' exonuclease and polymerase domains
MSYAMKYDVPEDSEIRPVIAALSEMQTVQTRRGLYWNTYPNFVHWKTGKVHPSLRQSATNTRRHTSARPNVQQVSKHPKAEGETPRVREVYVPHHADAVVVSMDEDAQELRIIADYSQDPNMVACFVGDSKKKMHALTGLGILKTWGPEYEDLDYEAFMAAYKEGRGIFKDAYTIGKKVNFTTEYGAQAPKLAETLIISQEEAQLFIDAKEAAFPVARAWKTSVEDATLQSGGTRTMLGAVRHLADALMGDDKYEASKALRQAVNFDVQSSSAEMIKRAIGAMWRARLRFRFDCRFMFPVHDEVVWSIAIKDLLPFLREAHACMVQPYAGMRIPIVSSIAFGKSFGPADQIEVGTEVDEKPINAGLLAWQLSKEAA